MIEPKKEHGNILSITRGDQYRTVNELFNRSHDDSIYKLLLVVSTIIVACGLLLGNSPIVIGGMLMTPLLSPILVVALAVAVGRFSAAKDAIRIALYSFALILGASFFLALILGVPQQVNPVFQDTFRSALLYFMVAIASGVAGTFAWVRKEIADILPGMAIAVSLVPPLSLVGIWLSHLEMQQAQFFFIVFVLNLLGIFIGSLIVFIILRFYEVEHHIEHLEKKIEEKRIEEQVAKVVKQNEESHSL